MWHDRDMDHRLVPLARDVTLESWHEAGPHHAVTCVSRVGPVLRAALLSARTGTPPRALWDAAVLVHDCRDLRTALQVANIRAHRTCDEDQAAAVSVLAIEIAPTAVQIARVGDGEAWLGGGGRWTPALPPLAPGDETWASPPVGRAPRLQVEMCRFARRPGLRLAIASRGTALGPLRLEHLGTWLTTTTAPAGNPDEGRVVISTRLGADRSSCARA